MNTRTSLFLVLLLGVLAGVAFWQASKPTQLVLAAPAPLFEGANAKTLSTIRLEHTQRGLQITLAKRADGWWITDPIEHPADAGVVDLIARIVEFNQIIPLTQEDPDLAVLGFEPPVGVVVLKSENAAGEIVTTRVEMGAADLDGKHVYVRVGDRVGRTVRNLTNTLERNLDEFRATRALLMDAGQIVEVHRTGYSQVSLATDRVDLALTAFRDGERWIGTSPISAALDPAMMQVIVRATTFLPILRHNADVPTDLSIYGLDQPWWRIALRTRDGEERALIFGRSTIDSNDWYAQREGHPAVFQVDPLGVRELTRPLTDLLDLRLLQAPKASIREIVYRSADAGVRLRLENRHWMVAPWAGEEWGAFEAADPSLVAAFLDRLSQSPLTNPRWGTGGVAFEAVAQLNLGTNEETTILSLARGPDLLMRDGEDVVHDVDTWLLERLDAPIASWRSLQLLRVDEVSVQSLTLSREGTERRWNRSDRGHWTRDGEDEEARELLKVLDTLLFLRGKGFLPLDGPALARPIDGRFLMQDGTEIGFRIGLATDDRGVLREALEAGGGRAFLGKLGLHARLAGLVAN